MEEFDYLQSYAGVPLAGELPLQSASGVAAAALAEPTGNDPFAKGQHMPEHAPDQVTTVFQIWY